MPLWPKVQIQLDSGAVADAQAPTIVSASRSTDIPAFYADWFFHRLQRGYSAWFNPFSGTKSYVAYHNTRFIVFWSKNPRPLLPHLDALEAWGIGCYIQFTLNDYTPEELERGVPPLQERIDTFAQLADRLGPERVIWRFDPLMLTEHLGIDQLLQRIERIGNQLLGLTNKLVFSFADIGPYRRVRANLARSGVRYLEWAPPQMEAFAQRLTALNQRWGYQLSTCAERIDLAHHGIAHNRCIDDELIVRLAHHDPALMASLGVEVRSIAPSPLSAAQLPMGAIALGGGRYAVRRRSNRDQGQRQLCGCAVSKDIGQYGTCPHLCSYCYANGSPQEAIAHLAAHRANPTGEAIAGDVEK